ncbi:MAG TPA: hypothetical protein P5179_10770 [Candidatus Latescibacteria bacterium]|nr:hypothetical protein [Candidatus Latescibacterota bacterium]
MPSLRIRGLVRAVRYVETRMRGRLTLKDADRLAHYVRSVVAEVRAICQNYGTSPEALPRPSREAFAFLNGLDAAHLDRAKPCRVAISTPVRISSVVRLTGAVLTDLGSGTEDESSECFVERCHARVLAAAGEIEALCRARGVDPREMAVRSRRAYGLLRYLSNVQTTRAYVRTAANLKRICGELRRREGADSSAPVVTLDDHSHIYRCGRGKDAPLVLHLSPAFIGAPEEVLESVARLAFGIGAASDKKAVHTFIHGPGALAIIQEIAELTSGPSETRGAVYDLREVCERVRNRYFDDPPDPPSSLAWTDSLTYRMFGLYSSVRDRITISRSLDSPKVPGYVIDYVMFHELLHKKHGIGWASKQRTMHTSRFRREEHAFPRFKAAQEFLNRLSSQMRRRLT